MINKQGVEVWSSSRSYKAARIKQISEGQGRSHSVGSETHKKSLSEPLRFLGSWIFRSGHLSNIEGRH